MTVSLATSITGTGPALVLLHPVGLDKSFWGPLVAQASRHFRTVAVDLAGHGESDPVPGNRGIAAYAEDVRALIDDLGGAPVVVLGLSFGGMIAQEFTVTHPDMVRGLVAGACGARIPAAAQDAVRARGTAGQGPDGMAAVLDETLARWFTPAFADAPEVARVRQRLLDDDPVGWAAGWDAIAGFDVLDRLPSLRLPALAVAGTLDAGTPVEGTRAIAQAIPDCRFEVLEGAPHMMQIECPEAFCAAVMPFLRTLAE